MYTYHHNRVLCKVNFRFYIFTNLDWISNSVWLLNKSISICPTLSLSSYPPSLSLFKCFYPYPKHCKVMIPHELIVRLFPSFFNIVSAAHHSYLALSVKNFKKLRSFQQRLWSPPNKIKNNTNIQEFKTKGGRGETLIIIIIIIMIIFFLSRIALFNPTRNQNGKE